jgi:phosphoserine phosphatase
MKTYKIAFVDFDETLIDKKGWHTYSTIYFNYPLGVAHILRFIVLILLFPLIYTSSVFNKELSYKILIYILLYRLKQDTVNNIIYDDLKKKLLKSINKKVLEDLEGKKVYIISGNLLIVINSICKDLNFKSYGTNINTKNNRISKKILDIPIGFNKLEYVNKIIEKYKKKNIKIETWGYGNSFNDYWMLKNLDHIVLVKPSSKILKKLDNYNNIKIIR